MIFQYLKTKCQTLTLGSSNFLENRFAIVERIYQHDFVDRQLISDLMMIYVGGLYLYK